MKSAMMAFELDDDDLKEHSYIYFANSAKVMGRQFDVYLAQLVPMLLRVTMETELIAHNPEDDDDPDDEEDDDHENLYINVRDCFVNSKKAALTALGAMAEHTHEGYAPYLESTIEAIINQDKGGALFSYHDIIRAEAVECLQQLTGVVCYAQGVSQKPPKLETVPLPPLATQVLQTALKTFVIAMGEDHSKLVVSTACEAVGVVVQRVGVAALNLVLEDVAGKKSLVSDLLMQKVLLLISEKAPCQKVTAESQAQGDDEDDEGHETSMLDAAGDLIVILSQTVGEQIVPYFDSLQKPLLKFMKPTRAFSERSSAIGTYVEVLLEIGQHALKYIDTILPIIRTSLSDPMEGVRRNAAYGLGVVVRVAGPVLVPHYMTILQSLHPLCTRPVELMGADKGGADVDNALSTVAHMIKGDIATMGPALPHVLPVLLAALPLRSDLGEGANVYGCLIELTLNGNASAMSLLPQILAAFGKCFFFFFLNSKCIL